MRVDLANHRVTTRICSPRSMACSTARSPSRSASGRVQNYPAGEDVEVPFDRMLQLVKAELQPTFARQPRDAAKRKVHYADTNYALLGAVIETLTGKPLHEVFATELFDPLGLDQTSSYPHDRSTWPRTAAVASVRAKAVELGTDGMRCSPTAASSPRSMTSRGS